MGEPAVSAPARRAGRAQPGVTRNQRAELVAAAWAGLAERGLASGGRVDAELADRLALLAYPERSVDGWIWTDREIRGLAAQAGRQAMLGVVDRGEVWLIPARDTLVRGGRRVHGRRVPAGRGRSVSVPLDALRAADAAAGGDPKAMIVELTERDVPLGKAQVLAGMFAGMVSARPVRRRADRGRPDRPPGRPGGGLPRHATAAGTCI